MGSCPNNHKPKAINSCFHLRMSAVPLLISIPSLYCFSSLQEAIPSHRWNPWHLGISKKVDFFKLKAVSWVDAYVHADQLLVIFSL